MQTTPAAPSQPTPPAPPPPPSPPSPPVSGLPDPANPAVAPAEGSAAGAVVRALPRTAQDVAGLREQRRELSNQLTSAQSRRRDVARALERADNPANRAGLEQRLGVLDRRIAQIENDMAETGRLITNAPSALLATSEPAGFLVLGRNGPSANAAPALLIVVLILQIVLLARSRGLGRRGPVTRPDPAQREAAERLARVEQAVDAIAVEVERVSEGQRFVTRLLAESRQAPELARPEDTLDVVPRQG